MDCSVLAVANTEPITCDALLARELVEEAAAAQALGEAPVGYVFGAGRARRGVLLHVEHRLHRLAIRVGVEREQGPIVLHARVEHLAVVDLAVLAEDLAG